MSSSPDPEIDAGFRKLRLDQAARHVFLCGGPDCCAEADGLASWEMLKGELKRAGIAVLRTRAACLRVCAGGPWLVVYPDGVWYGAVTPERCRRIVQEHLHGNRPVTEWIARVHPLGPPPL